MALEDISKWHELIAIPFEWVKRQVGIYKRDGLLFPIENTSSERTKLLKTI